MNRRQLMVMLVIVAIPALLPAAERSPLSEMVTIPTGPFSMGSNTGPEDERPAHQVTLAAFTIDRFPVSNARFTEFLNHADDGREDLSASPVRATRGGGHDSPAGEITTTQRGRNLSRNPRAGHHNISFRCARWKTIQPQRTQRKTKTTAGSCTCSMASNAQDGYKASGL